MPEDMVLAQGEMGAVTRAVSSTEDAERLNWYLRAILTANVYDVAVESALDYAPRLSEKVGAKIHLKREDLQPVKSFKLRGAYNRMAAISPGGAGEGRHLLERRQPRAGRGAGGERAGLRRRDRDAGHDARHQGGRRAAAGRHRRAGGGELRRLPGVRQGARRDGRAHVRPPVRRPAGGGGAGHGGHGDRAAAPRGGGRVRPGGRRRAHRGHRRVRQEHPPGRQGDRRRAGGRQRHGAVAVPRRDLPAGQGGRLRRTASRCGRWARCASTCASSWWTA